MFLWVSYQIICRTKVLNGMAQQFGVCHHLCECVFLRVFLLGVLSFMIPVLRQLADIAQQMKLNRNKWLLNFCGRSFLIDHKNTLFTEYTQFEMKDFEIGAVFFLNTSFQPYMFSTLNDSFNEIVLLQTLFAIPTALTVSVDLSFRLHNVHSSIHSIYIYSNQ